MGTELIVAGIGLAVSAVGTGYSIYASEKAAAEAEDIADDNAKRQQMESEEMAQRAEEEADRELSLSRARAAASGAEGESQEIYMDDLASTKQREIDWIRRSGLSGANITRKQGASAASGIRSEGISSGIAGLGNLAGIAGSVDWSSLGNKTPSFDASADHKKWA